MKANRRAHDHLVFREELPHRHHGQSHNHASTHQHVGEHTLNFFFSSLVLLGKNTLCGVGTFSDSKKKTRFCLGNLFLFGLSKKETGDKTAPRVQRLGFFDERVLKLSSGVNLAT